MQTYRVFIYDEEGDDLSRPRAIVQCWDEETARCTGQWFNETFGTRCEILNITNTRWLT